LKNLIIGLWLLLGVGYWGLAKYSCPDKAHNNRGSSSGSYESPFSFDPNSSELKTGLNFDNYADSIVNSLAPNEIIVLTGLLSQQEEEINKDLGRQRAKGLLALLNIKKERTQIESRVVEELPSHLSYVEVKRLSNESVIVERDVTHDGDINQHSTIYFPFNSTDKLDDARVEKFLDEIAKRVQGSGERVLLVGHTDKIGPREYNYALGDKRAKSIKYYLISRGVNPKKIITQSQGELNQVGSASDRNRRTEVKLLR